MGKREYEVFLHRPQVRVLLYRKSIIDIIFILTLAGAVIYIESLLSTSITDDTLSLCGDVFLAAGFLPFLISLPTILSRLSLAITDSCCCRSSEARLEACADLDEAFEVMVSDSNHQHMINDLGM